MGTDYTDGAVPNHGKPGRSQSAFGIGSSGRRQIEVFIEANPVAERINHFHAQ